MSPRLIAVLFAAVLVVAAGTSGLVSWAVTSATAGVAGADGAPGRDGARGADGAEGLRGEDGVDGTDGERGLSGPTGPRGATGPQGAPGANGTDGTDGTDGADGVDGATGPVGPAGLDAIVDTSDMAVTSVTVYDDVETFTVGTPLVLTGSGTALISWKFVVQEGSASLWACSAGGADVTMEQLAVGQRTTLSGSQLVDVSAGTQISIECTRSVADSPALILRADAFAILFT